MAEAKGRDNWAHTSAVLAMIANVNRDPKRSAAFQPADFDPYRPRKPTRVSRQAGFEMLKAVFTGGPRRQGR